MKNNDLTDQEEIWLAIKKQGLTQHIVAAFNEISEPKLSRYLHGDLELAPEKVEQIKAYLNIQPDAGGVPDTPVRGLP